MGREAEGGFGRSGSCSTRERCPGTMSNLLLVACRETGSSGGLRTLEGNGSPGRIGHLGSGNGVGMLRTHLRSKTSKRTAPPGGPESPDEQSVGKQGTRPGDGHADVPPGSPGVKMVRQLSFGSRRTDVGSRPWRGPVDFGQSCRARGAARESGRLSTRRRGGMSTSVGMPELRRRGISVGCEPWLDGFVHGVGVATSRRERAR